MIFHGLLQHVQMMNFNINSHGVLDILEGIFTIFFFYLTIKATKL